MWNIKGKKGFRIRLACTFSFFLLLTVLIYLSADKLMPVVTTVQSIYAFNNIWLTALLYYIWFSILVVLILLQGSQSYEKVKILSICIFILIFSGIWIILRPIPALAGEAPGHGAAIDYINRNGNLNCNFYYYKEYPGISILSSLISEICGIKSLDTLSLLTAFQLIFFPIMLFTFFNRALGNYTMASLAILVLINANIIIDKLLILFHPRMFVLLFLTTFLIIYSKDPLFESKRNILLLFILVTAITITHLVSSFIPFFVMLGICLICKKEKWRKEPRALSMYLTTTLTIVIPLVWLFYQAISWSTGLVQGVYCNILKYFSESLPYSEYILNISMTYFARAPLWEVVTRDFWLMILALSYVVAFWHLVTHKNSNSAGLMLKGGFLGVGICTVLITLMSRTIESDRIFNYLPLFSIPILLSCIRNLNSRFKNRFIAVLLTVMIIFSFPTFLAHNNSVGSLSYYIYELSSGEFVKSEFDYREEITVFSANMFTVLSYYVPNAQFKPVSLTSLNDSLNLLHAMITSSLMDKDVKFSLFILNENKTRSEFMRHFGIDIATYLRYIEFKAKLSRENLIYNNHYEQFYVPD